MTATVRMIEGRLVLDDPDALAVMKAVDQANCRGTLRENLDRVHYFVQRMRQRSLSPDEVVIVLLNVDDPHGGPLASALMPGTDWQEIRDRGQIPFARGLAYRAGIQLAVDAIDREIGDKLRGILGRPVVVVVDHGVVDVFDVEE